MSDDVGECILTWFDDPVTLQRRLRIDRADPSTWITDEWLEGVTKTWEPIIDDGQHKGWTSRLGQMLYTDRGTALRIDAENGSVTYRLDHYDPKHNAWLARWPD